MVKELVETRGGDLCSLEVRVRICRTYRRSRRLDCVGLCAGMADRLCPAFIMEAGAKGNTAVRLYPVRVREHGAVLHASTMARERLAVYI